MRLYDHNPAAYAGTHRPPLLCPSIAVTVSAVCSASSIRPHWSPIRAHPPTLPNPTLLPASHRPPHSYHDHDHDHDHYHYHSTLCCCRLLVTALCRFCPSSSSSTTTAAAAAALGTNRSIRPVLRRLRLPTRPLLDMSDIEKSFTYLQDGIPQWLQDITRLEEKVAAMQDEMARVPVSVSPFAKRKTDSIESIRHDRLGAIAEHGTLSQGAQTDPAGNRKRKTLSVLSGHASGPSRFRPRTMVVVSYDGDMQKSFELLVRAIGTGRNLLRKAKMEAKMQELAALTGSSDSEDDGDTGADDNEEAAISKLTYRPRLASMRARAAAQRTRRPGPNGVNTVPVELFDTTDKVLEQAQEQCERAAHLTLREGDCRTELQQVRKNVSQVLDIAKTQVDKYHTQRSSEPPELQPHDTSDTSVSSIEPSYKQQFPQISMPPPEPEPQPKGVLPNVPSANVSSQPKIIDIEVDDDIDDDDEDFVMPPVRLTSRLGARA